MIDRRHLLQGFAGLVAGWLLPACVRSVISPLAAAESTAVTPIDRPRGFWRDKVTPAAYDVLFRSDTEPPFSSPLNTESRTGLYICAACYLPLFHSTHKYESGTGWPSFTQPLPGRVGTKRDFKLIWPRTAYHCARCGGHQGHVFNDGPPPRGERWCNNGLALDFVPESTPLPPLRG
jgi:peptide-methionine (R)-S-oxide reductase